MIEIPYNVKRALRVGRYKKNYKFLVSKTAEGYIPFTFSNDSSSDHHVFTVPYDGTYDIDGDIDGVYCTIAAPAGGEVTYQALTRTLTLEKDYTVSLSSYDPSVSPISIIYYGEHEITFTIDNDNLVKESVMIDERMSSGNELKFGLCEGSSLEFQYFGYPNIRGAEIQAFISIQYKNDLGSMAWYDIPMGWFTVDECPMQFSTGIYKVTAYNKLMSKYLDAKCTEQALELAQAGEYGYTDRISVHTILRLGLQGYSIEPTYEKTKFNFDGVKSRNWYAFECCNSSGQLTGEKAYIAVQSFTMVLTPEEFYFFHFYGDNIWQNAMNAWPGCWYALIKERGTVETLRNYALDGQNRVLTGGFELRGSYAPNGRALLYYNCINGDITTDQYSQSIWLFIALPIHAQYGQTQPPIIDSDWDAWYQDKWANWDWRIKNYADVYKLNLSDAEKMILTTAQLSAVQDLTLRELQSAVYETVAQFGQLDRVTDLFSGVELNGGGLYPAETLYPAADLYPGGRALHPFPSEYQKLWTDTVGEQTFRYLIITYKTTETVSGQTQEVEKTLQRTVNTNGTTDYNMSDNWLFRNLIWTSEQVGEYADAMVEKMRGIKWFPFEMWATGLPYVETGDAIEITDREGDTHISYILQRQLKGIHGLQDTYINGELDIF